MNTNSQILFERAKQIFPGGVNSPVRAFKSVGGTPPFMAQGEGACLLDVDGYRYVDYVLSYGPLVLGHAHPAVNEAINNMVLRGTTFGTPSEHALQLGELIQKYMPSLEMLRFVNSGTEATMSALRLARAFTGRNKIVKFEGCYHGHADYLLVKAGSGVATLGLPDSPGVTPSTTVDTLVAPYNDLTTVENLFDQFGNEIAGVIVEPVAGNMGLVQPVDGFLSGLRKLCDNNSSLLIFDEVMTGFRVHPGGAQTRYNIAPDLTTLGKVIGGGLPVGAYGGRQEIMEMVAPVGPMYQAGTLSGNPIAMAAGKANIETLMTDSNFETKIAYGERLDEALRNIAARNGVEISLAREGSMSGMYFSSNTPTNWEQVSQTNTEQFKIFFHEMLANGVFLAPSPFEAAFVSAAHDDDAFEQTIAAAEKAFQRVAERGEVGG